nr:MAG TPA: hypothetical protein [Caudoviricetes sp.]
MIFLSHFRYFSAFSIVNTSAACTCVLTVLSFLYRTLPRPSIMKGESTYVI